VFTFLMVIAGVKVFMLIALALVIGLVAGAQIASHEERKLNYNLEDVELDILHNIETRVHGEERKVIARVRELEQSARDRLGFGRKG
jgi:hypothetical protein